MQYVQYMEESASRVCGPWRPWERLEKRLEMRLVLLSHKHSCCLCLGRYNPPHYNENMVPHEGHENDEWECKDYPLEQGGRECDKPDPRDDYTNDATVTEYGDNSLGTSCRLHELCSDEYTVEGRLGTDDTGIVWHGSNSDRHGKRSVLLLRFGHQAAAGVSAQQQVKQRAMLRQEVNRLVEKRVDQLPGLARLYFINVAQAELAMEAVSAPSLAKLMLQADGDDEEKALGLGEVLEVVKGVAVGLSRLHAKGLVHGALRPENVFVQLDDGSLQVKQVGYGLSETWRSFEIKLGTNGPGKFSAPEVRGGKPCTAASDAYSLAVLTGQLMASFCTVCTSTSSVSTVDTIGQLQALASRHGELAELLQSCLYVKPDKRGTMESVIECLNRCPAALSFGERHGTSIVYHVVEPGDKLVFSSHGRMLHLERKPMDSTSAGKEHGLLHHVQHGSGWTFRSPFLSCTRSFVWAIHYSNKQDVEFHNDRFPTQPILELDLSLMPDAVEGSTLHDIGSPELWERAGLDLKNVTVQRFAAAAREVVLEGVPVPREAITAVYCLSPSQNDKESNKDHKNRCKVSTRINFRLLKAPIALRWLWGIRPPGELAGFLTLSYLCRSA